MESPTLSSQSSTSSSIIQCSPTQSTIKIEPSTTQSSQSSINQPIQPLTRQRFYVCLNVYPTLKKSFKQSIDRWKTPVSQTTNTQESRQNERICKCMNVHKLTINAAVLCIISGVLRLVVGNPTLFVPFNIYNGTYDIAPNFVEEHPSIMAVNKNINYLEAFFLIVISCALTANYKNRYAHYYCTFSIFMAVSTVTSFIRLLQTVAVYLFYSEDLFQSLYSKNSEMFWIHFGGFLLSMIFYVLIALIVMKARGLILEGLPKNTMSENGSQQRGWKLLPAQQKRQEWIKKNANQQPISTKSSLPV